MMIITFCVSISTWDWAAFDTYSCLIAVQTQPMSSISHARFTIRTFLGTSTRLNFEEESVDFAAQRHYKKEWNMLDMLQYVDCGYDNMNIFMNIASFNDENKKVLTSLTCQSDR